MSWKFLLLTVNIFLVGSVSCFPEGRVVNGTATDVRKFPFIVSLRSRNGYHFCGGSIIAPSWILTAAHCVAGLPTDSGITIQYASTTINPESENVIGVKRIIIHENYISAGSYPNDIALVELQGTLIFNYDTLAPVRLPVPYFEIPQTQEGGVGVLAGWGYNETMGNPQTTLQEVYLKIYSDEECRQRHDGETSRDHICGGVDEGGKGQCSGDSGGPFLYNGYVQLGIVSWSIKPCGLPPYPGVYTKVSHYIYWIYGHIMV